MNGSVTVEYTLNKNKIGVLSRDIGDIKAPGEFL